MRSILRLHVMITEAAPPCSQNKFTLKPPYRITHDKLQLAIWYTSFCTFLGQIWTQRTLRHMLGPILVIFEICHFWVIPGPFEYFSEMGGLRKSKFSQ